MAKRTRRDRVVRPPVDLRTVAAEALPLVGGGRALLLQVAFPSVGRGVVEHSDFAERAMDRLHATMTFMCAAVFATPEEFAVVRRRVNRAHAPVRAEATAAAPAYNAYDPELQLWVAATLYRTMTDLHETVFGPLSPAEQEGVYQEYTRLGANLQVPPSSWPASREAFDAYWESMLERLRVGNATRTLAKQILYPRNVPGWVRLLLPDARLVTAGLLPTAVREQYRLPWGERQQRQYDRWMRRLARWYPRMPRRLRHAPRDAYLRRVRRLVREEAGANR
ncbi:oxygenase MpaB family protein [Leifsonia sp. NPDC058194]|uniref:oxygenase MpaB family protein n=1 Tax=Leifsonia sp. NPDC058194 TaxID=3346374 RepID=UPI0036D920AC